MNFAYTLTEPGNVEVPHHRFVRPRGRVVPAAGASVGQRRGVGPGVAAGGLYLARLRFWGNTSDVVKILPVGIIK